MTELHARNAQVVDHIGRGANSTRMVFAYVEANPIIEIQKTATALHMSYNTVSIAVKRLCDAGILVPTSNARRNRLFTYDAYVRILKEDT